MITARGIDVSRYQGRIDWRRVHESGIGHCYIKWSEVRDDVLAQSTVESLQDYRPDPTTTTLDPPEAGLYHLWRPHLGIDQVDSIRRAYRRYHHLRWPPALDLETRRLREATPEQLATLPDTLRALYYSCSRGHLMVYVSARGAKLLRAARLWDAVWDTGASLWLMDRRSTPLELDGAPAWTWLQHSSAGSVPGIGGRVDLDTIRLQS